MQWNWQYNDWPNFIYDAEALIELEVQFQHQAGIMLGTLKHIENDPKNELIVDLISTEAIKSSEIEGEYLNRDSVQSSIKRNFGLDAKQGRVSPAEQGIAEMMVDLYKTFATPLSLQKLWDWHRMLTAGRRDLSDFGRFRRHEEPMQIVSGAVYARKVHFEAPPSERVAEEIARFIAWYNDLPSTTPLTNAAIAHLYFESIHPFEDGNGRIGRALSEKLLSQAIGQPTLLALSQTIESNRKSYYQHLERYNKGLETTGWIDYFARTILDAQLCSQELIEFLLAKTKLYDRLHGQLNARQNKVIERMFREGPDGFKGGLSADNYMTIAGTTRPTTTRDLADLVEKDALRRTGERRYTRYWLNV